ncbi:MAG: ATP-binding protein, partial [Roseiarcus sp.]
GTPGRDHSVPVGGIISLWWAASFRYGGRHHLVIVGDIDRNQHIAHGDARYARLLRSLARVKLLILDDWGPEALTPGQARDLLEIVEDRYDKGSLIITSQVPVGRWHDLIGVPTLGDAILDRVIHNAYRIELAGESLRKRRSSP